MDITIRKLLIEDIEQLAALQQKVFSKKHSLNHVIIKLKWKYFSNPNGNILGCVAVDDKQKIIGVYGGIPIKLKIGNEKINSYQIVTTAVDPEYRNQSILKKLFAFNQEQILEANKGSICFGFPNPLALSIGRKNLNYYQVLKIFTFQIILNTKLKLDFPIRAKDKKSKHGILSRIVKKIASPFIKTNTYKNFTPNRNISIKHSENIPKDYQEFWNKIESNYLNIVVRDEDYLTWRIFSNPSAKLEFYEIRENNILVGFFALSFGTEVVVADFLCLKDRELVEDAFYMMMELISSFKTAQSVKFPVYDEYLELLLQSNRVQVCDLSAFAQVFFSEKDSDIINNFNIPGAWYLTGNEYLIG